MEFIAVSARLDESPLQDTFGIDHVDELQLADGFDRIGVQTEMAAAAGANK